MGVKILFWVFLFVVFYTYLGYGILLWLMNRVTSWFGQANRPAGSAVFEPSAALVIAAYNEEECIEEKINNTLALHYPAHKLAIYFVTDGSTDNSPLIIGRYPRITLLHQPERYGKAAAMNRAMQFIKEPYVIFSDANTMLNKDCIKELLKFYADPAVGAVAGEKKIYRPANTQTAQAGEGLYWKYESFLKKQDSDFYTVVGAAGELFSVRTDLYQPVEQAVLIEDFVLSLRVAQKGYVVKYAPLAYAVETGSASMKDEQKRKIRISAGGFQAMYLLRDLLNVFKYGRLSFQYISHRVLRWSITPVCLLLLLPLNIVIVLFKGGIWYEILLAAQACFYLAAMTGWIFANRNMKIKGLYIPYYFLFMNLSVIWGLKRFLKGQQSVLWEKAARKKVI